ncbi:Chromatin modification-related protein EAF1 A [Linum perenne]
MTGSIPSPAASQMSNMPSTNRFMRLINGRDKGRKAKSMSSGQPGFGSSWSLFEDQLVSDAINSTLHFKVSYITWCWASFNKTVLFDICFLTWMSVNVSSVYFVHLKSARNDIKF